MNYFTRKMTHLQLSEKIALKPKNFFVYFTPQEMKFFINDFFGKCDSRYYSQKMYSKHFFAQS